jgi:hypothetical protein
MLTSSHVPTCCAASSARMMLGNEMRAIAMNVRSAFIIWQNSMLVQCGTLGIRVSSGKMEGGCGSEYHESRTASSNYMTLVVFLFLDLGHNQRWQTLLVFC